MLTVNQLQQLKVLTYFDMILLAKIRDERQKNRKEILYGLHGGGQRKDKIFWMLFRNPQIVMLHDQSQYFCLMKSIFCNVIA